MLMCTIMMTPSHVFRYSPALDFVVPVALSVEFPPTGGAVKTLSSYTPLKVHRYLGPDSWALIVVEVLVLLAMGYQTYRIKVNYVEHQQGSKDAAVKAAEYRTHLVESTQQGFEDVATEVAASKLEKRSKEQFFYLFRNWLDVALVVMVVATLVTTVTKQILIGKKFQEYVTTRCTT